MEKSTGPEKSMEKSTGPEKSMEKSTETKASIAESATGSRSTAFISDSGDWQTTVEESLGNSPSGVSFRSLNPWHLYLAFRRAKIITVEPVVFLYMFAVFMNISLVQQYYYSRLGKEKLLNTSFPYPQNTSFCINSSELEYYAGNGTANEVESSAVNLIQFAGLAQQIPSVLTALILGPLSDLYGRKLIIYVVAAGATLQGLLAILLVHFELNVYFYILISGVGGFTGGFASILTAAMSYIADVSSLRWRIVRIGIVEAMIFLAGALGQGGLGVWLTELNCSFLPALCLFTACNAAIIVYSLIFLPESLTHEERIARAKRHPSRFKNLVQGLRIFFCGLKYSTWRLWAALIAMSVVVANMAGYQLISISFYKAPQPLDWNPEEIGTFQMVNMLTHGFVALFILPILVGIKLPDALVAMIGLTLSAGMDVFTGFVAFSWEMYVVSVVASMEAVIVPSVRGILSKLVAAQDQGALFSFVASAEVLSAAIATAIYPNVYNWTIQRGLKSGTTFILMAIFCAISAPMLLLLLLCRRRQKDPNEEDADPNEEDSKKNLEKPLNAESCERDSLLGELRHSSDYGSNGVANSQGSINS